METKRASWASNLGFLMAAIGSAVGLGNIWGFPYKMGKSGGFAYLAVYALLAIFVGFIVMASELAMGRKTGQGAMGTYHALTKKFRWIGWLALFSPFAVMGFYAVLGGYCIEYMALNLSNFAFGSESLATGGELFAAMLSNPAGAVLFAALFLALCYLINRSGISGGIEKFNNVGMPTLFVMLVVIIIRSLTLPGAEAGVSFYLSPDPSKLEKTGLFPVINAAMNQAFFTLSVGIGAMCIFGSYQSRDRSLTGEAMWIMGLDTFVALMAGLIIFPACFAFGVEPGAGPGLVFVTLPNIFNVMAGGRLWGTLFFIFMSFAALSTVIAVFENIISYSADVWGMERRRATWLHAVGIWLFSLPCALGFNLLAGFQPLGPGTSVLDLEDFLISNNILPLGGLFFLLFCCLRRGWGWDNFIAEVDQGTGMKFPRWLRGYVTYVLPCLIIFVFVMGYVDKFCK